MRDTYLVKEFADLAGVTVRTLHYYDQVGLLKPSQYTSANHRLYRRDDLLRLQQILTLKYLGFSLDEIQNVLNSPGYDLRASLRLQKQAVDQRITELQQVSRALAKVLSENGELDWQSVDDVIRGVTAENKYGWFAQFFSPDQQAVLLDRQAQLSPEQVQAMLDQGQRDWAEVIDGFRKLRHESPDHPDVQKLAEKAISLIDGFTQGDQELFQALGEGYRRLDEMPEDIRPYDSVLQQFIYKAIEIYQEKHKP
jgi:DNA-binding transcriptional MerR regulator